MSFNLQLSFDLLKNSYKSIDMCGLLVRTPKADYKWKCIYLTIRLTEFTLEQLLQIQKKKENNLGKINGESFKLIYESKTIDEIRTIINDINKKTLKMNSILCSIEGSSLNDILQSKISLEDDYKFGKQNKSIFVICHQNSGNSLYKVLNDLDVPYNEFVSNDEDIFKWFDLKNPVREASLIITMPIILVETPLTKQEQKDYLKKFYVHNTLKFKCTLQLTPNNNDKPKKCNVEAKNILIDHEINAKTIDQDHLFFIFQNLIIH